MRDYQFIYWALLTVFCWGTYGVCMHAGADGMGQEAKDTGNHRFMAFLWVGIAYFLTAVVAPLIILKLRGGNIAFWTYPTQGWKWSLIAGTLGAIGALGVLLAFGKMPSPAYVAVIMSIIFAGAPIVNAIVNTTDKGLWGKVKDNPLFLLGICCAALGGVLVTKYAPKPDKPQVQEEAAAKE
jgi:drug/metabolite transporter (DMT)-like permease